jgi:hypothetical protein
MQKKTWLLLILVAAFLLGYFKLFYTTMPNNVVPANTDAILSIDVKKNIRTAIWHYIINPSKWSLSSSKVSADDKVDLKDMFTLPDFALAFHIKNEPLKNWYTVLNIKEDEAFYKGLKQFGFEKLKQHIYINASLQIAVLINNKKVLVGSNINDSCVALSNVAQNLFVEKKFNSSATLQKLKQANSHAALYIATNNFLKEETICKLNYTETDLKVEANLFPHNLFSFTESNFEYASNSLVSLGFTQPCDSLYNFINNESKANILQKVGINIDSIFTKSNKFYTLDFQNIIATKDSAISYTFDDDFNKVEQVVVNNVEEPAYKFLINGDSVTSIFKHSVNNKIITVSDTGNIFTAMPFVKSYCTLPSKNEFNISAKNYKIVKADKSVKAILFLRLYFDVITESTKKYLPASVANVLNNAESLELKATKVNEKILLQLNVSKNDKATSLFSF